MPVITKPDFTYKWASGGSSIAPSDVKIQTGWTAEVPPFQWENWSQNRQDNAIAHIFQHGISTWDATTEYQFSTVGVKSLVMGSNGTVYRAKQVNTNQDPVTDISNTYWEVAFLSGNSPTGPTLATTPQAQAGTNNTAYISPLRLFEAFKGGNQSLVTNGYQTFPGGLIIQWGFYTISTTSSVQLYSFPIAFPNNSFLTIGSDGVGAVPAGEMISVESLSSTQFRAYRSSGTGTTGFFILSIGN